MREALNNMLKGLALHYLHQGTVEQAIEQGRIGGVPDELLECLPGMMFEVTSAAAAIFGAGRGFDEVVDELTHRAFASGNAGDFGRQDTAALVKDTIEFLTELGAQRELDSPLPEVASPWYAFGTKKRPTTGSGGRRVRR
jgi:hypothetical protein